MDLNELRRQIDAVDEQLIALLEKRLDISAAIGAYKSSHGLPVLDQSREEAKVRAVRAQCRQQTADLIGDLYGPIIAASRTYQARLREDENGR